MTADARALVNAVHAAIYALRSSGRKEAGATARINPVERDNFLRALDRDEWAAFTGHGSIGLKVLGVPINPDTTVAPGRLVVDTPASSFLAPDVQLPDRQTVTVERIESTRVTVLL